MAILGTGKGVSRQVEGKDGPGGCQGREGDRPSVLLGLLLAAAQGAPVERVSDVGVDLLKVPTGVEERVSGVAVGTGTRFAIATICGPTVPGPLSSCVCSTSAIAGGIPWPEDDGPVDPTWFGATRTNGDVGRGGAVLVTTASVCA